MQFFFFFDKSSSYACVKLVSLYSEAWQDLFQYWQRRKLCLNRIVTLLLLKYSLSLRSELKLFGIVSSHKIKHKKSLFNENIYLQEN